MIEELIERLEREIEELQRMDDGGNKNTAINRKYIVLEYLRNLR